MDDRNDVWYTKVVCTIIFYVVLCSVGEKHVTLDFSIYIQQYTITYIGMASKCKGWDFNCKIATTILTCLTPPEEATGCDIKYIRLNLLQVKATWFFLSETKHMFQKVSGQMDAEDSTNIE